MIRKMALSSTVPHTTVYNGRKLAHLYLKTGLNDGLEKDNKKDENSWINIENDPGRS